VKDFEVETACPSLYAESRSDSTSCYLYNTASYEPLEIYTNMSHQEPQDKGNGTLRFDKKSGFQLKLLLYFIME